ncbi:MAG TPA: alpha/beta hydrolase [Polyangiaceae bacterium]|nr:alpha/beta hydrolase [Polyangiaceae bacterium]
MANFWRWGIMAAAVALCGCEPVTVPGVKCGGTYVPNLTLDDGRTVGIDYPCDKPAGTPVTFILNLHGTYGTDEGRFYMHQYFAAYQHTNSHDLIVATPRSVVSQWGNGDGGQDLPHLLKIVDWVYTNFSKFDIRGVWVSGHSWGAAYANGLVCRQEFLDKLNQYGGKVGGVVLMSGGSFVPACANGMSVIATRGETDIVPALPDQSAVAGAHGCDAARNYTINYERTPGVPGQDTVTEWPNCDAKWQHKNFLMLGKGHGFVPNDWPDSIMLKDLVDTIVKTR